MRSHHHLLRCSLLLLLSLFALFADECGGDAGCDPSHRNLLLELKTGFNVSSLELDSWRPGSDCCNWEGVTCDSVSGMITELDLSGIGINGEIHPSLFKLASLQKLNLASNNFSQMFPNGFELLSNLVTLNLGSCGLRGTFPANVFLLKNLTGVDLSDNHMLSGSLPEFVMATRLETLVLWGTNFSGTIPPSIANLTQLTSLDLSFNRFTGSIPSSIGELRRLRRLDLSRNLLTGEIPGSLLLLPALQELGLSRNLFPGQLPGFSNASSQLEAVDLGHNMLHGELPSSVFQLSRLRVFKAEANNFSGEVKLDRFGDLQNLTYLDLSYNSLSISDEGDDRSLSLLKFRVLKLASCNLTRVPSFLRYQDEILALDLSFNKIHGDVPSWILSIGGLQELSLAGNSFTSLEPFLLDSNMSFPIRLDLHANSLSGRIPLPRGGFEILDYSNNSFSSPIPFNIGEYLLHASFFSLAGNRLTGEIPPSICNASLLRVLDFSGNRLAGAIPPCLLGGNNSLGVLNLQGNELHGRIPRHISEGCRLRSLHLNGNHLEGQLPDSLVNCNKLELIDLGNNHMRDSFPFWLTRIPSLRVLVLRSNGFYGPIEPQYSSADAASLGFPSLQILDISSNSFNGGLPSIFFMGLRGMMAPSARTNSSVVGYTYPKTFYQDSVTVTSKGSDREYLKILTIFTSIDLSNNAFTGEIPDVFGKLQSLNVLDLSHNHLTGQIPSAFKSMKQLESLDLSENRLSGEIPQELASLTFLGFLNLSCNDLVGRIPQGFQFSTFLNSSFAGNEGLCGIPLSKECHNITPIIGKTDAASKLDSSYVIEMALFTGLGYGVGIAIVLLLPNMSWEHISTRVSRASASITAWSRGAAANVRKKLMITEELEQTTPRS